MEDTYTRGRSKTPIETSTRALAILHAADELLAERGHDGVSMRDVAQRAGVNKALIFYYFGSRAQLFDKVLERYYRNHAKALAKAFSTEGSAHVRVRRAIDAYLDFIDQNVLFTRLLQQETAREEPQLPQIRQNLETLYEMMRDEFSTVLPEDGPLSARQFFISLSGVVMNYVTCGTAMADAFGIDPMSAEARLERRQHVYWLVETVVDRLTREGTGR